MATKLVAGHTVDINFDPSRLKFETRAQMSDTYMSYTKDEYLSLLVYYLTIAVAFVLLLFSIFIDRMFIFFLALMCYLALHAKFQYLKAWSKKLKWKRKRMVRIDE